MNNIIGLYRRRMMMASTGSLFPPIGTPLSDWTWEQIVALSNSGRDPQNYFSVGDEKDLILTTGEVVPVVIGDFYHNTITGTSTKAPIAFTFKNCLNTKYAMNDSGTNAGGWNSSKMRTTHMVNIFNTFPAELRAEGAVKYVDVLASAGGGSTAITTSSDRLRPHSIVELGLSYSYAASGEGTKYAYYTSGNRVKTVDGTASAYCTRSSFTGDRTDFCLVSASGKASYGLAGVSRGVACGFDIQEKMKYAIVKSDMVENVLVASPEQKEELEQALGAELVDAAPYVLQIGDMRVNGAWTRNDEGEQVILTGRPTYSELNAKNQEMQEALTILGMEV